MALKLTLMLDDAGRLQVDGPIHDKLVCLGLLEAAKMAIHQYQPPRVAPAAVIPSIAPLNGRGG